MLRLYIGAQWEPEDFIEVLSGVESLYYKVALTRRFLRESPYFWPDSIRAAASFEQGVAAANDWLLARSRTIADRRLRVRRIEYASPGKIDLLGIGEGCRAISDVILSFAKFFSERDLRREQAKQAQIETEMKQAELHEKHESLRSLKISNARALMSLRRDFPEISEDYFIALAAHDQDRLIPRIADGKLVSARTLSRDTPNDGEADA
jgi:hypothetical protein